MTSPLLPWLAKPWARLNAQRTRLPHALLIYGRPGLGKTLLARLFAQRVLCEGEEGELPCGRCASCLWFEQGNHPDFRIVEPEALAEPPGAEDRPRAGKEAPSRQVKIDQIRDLQGFLAIGTHRRGFRVVVLRPAEAMNAVTANALLKSLEEPPPRTLFLLVSSAPEQLLYTIRSRCQHIAVQPASKEAVDWLQSQGLKMPAEALAYSAHAPLAALESEAHRPARDAFLAQLAAREIDALALADACQGIAPAIVIDWVQRWAFDLALVKFTGTVRYHLRQVSALQAVAPRVAAAPLLRFERSLARERAVAEHPLNARLFLESVFLRYTQLMEPRHV